MHCDRIRAPGYLVVDPARWFVCNVKEATKIKSAAMPYVTRLLVSELAAANISLKFYTSKKGCGLK